MGKSRPWWVSESGETDDDTKIRAEYNYQLRRLYSKNLFLRVKLGLRNIRAMDRVLGMPHRSYDVVHVAGTNGKGSVALKVAQACRVGSNKTNSRPLVTGLFTSPHVASFRERVRVQGKPWTMQEATACLQAAEAAAERADVPATFFELVTMAALLAFRRAGCDVVVLECGLGGRLDATSVVRNTAVASVVSVGLDHVAVLGPTLSDVAREKAGIFRKNAPDAVHVLGAKDGDAVDATAAQPARGGSSAAREPKENTVLPDSDGGVRAAVIGPGSCSGLLQQLARDAGVERIRVVGGGVGGRSSDMLEAASSVHGGASGADHASEEVEVEYAPEDYDQINSEVARAIVEELGEVTSLKLPAGKELDRALEARPAGRFEVLNLHVDQVELLASNADDTAPGRGLHGGSASKPTSVQVIMDSAHNPVASRSLVKLLMARFPDTFPRPPQPAHGDNTVEVSARTPATPRRLVLGLSSDRSPEDMLRAWKGVVHQDELVCCEADSTRAASAASIAASAREVLGRRQSSPAGAGPVAIPRQTSSVSTSQGDKEQVDRQMQAREEHLKRLREAREAAGPGRARGRHEWEGAEPLPASDPKRVAAGLSTDGIGARYREGPGSGAWTGSHQGGDTVQEWEEAGRRIGGSRGASGLVRAAGSSVASAVDNAIRDAVAESTLEAEKHGVPQRPPVVVIAGSVYLLAEARGALLRRALDARPWESQYQTDVAEALLGEVEPDDVVK